MQQVAQGLASLGRGDDSMLVHMTQGEVDGLQKLAMKHGGSLTINPHTGLPEAGILSALLPMAAGFALGPAGFGLMSSSLGAAAAVGGLGALATGSLGKGLKYGLGAYGGSELASGLSGVGADQANKLAAAEAVPVGNKAAELAMEQGTANNVASVDELVKQATANPEATMTPQEYREFLTKQVPTTIPGYNSPIELQQQGEFARQQAIDSMQFKPETQKALDSPMRTGLGQLTEKGGMSALGSKLGYGGAAAIAAPLLYGMTQQKQNTLAPLPGQTFQQQQYTYNPGTRRATWDAPNQNPYSAPNNTSPYFEGQGYTRTAAQGGLLDSMEQNSYPQARLPLQHMSRGGLEDTQEYAAGGKLLRGPGDGMSDSIPAVIKGAKPQRAALADGEFVIPADVVSHLGNGSTEAGAKRLYAMMDKVRHARTGNPKQGKQINPERFMPA